MKKFHGFSLLELSFVLMIVGVLLSFSLPMLLNSVDVEKNKVTRDRFEKITHAIAAYVDKNQVIPCPFVVNQGENHSKCPSVGIVPYQALGLHPSMAKDGFNHFITYVINKDFIKETQGSYDSLQFDTIGGHKNVSQSNQFMDLKSDAPLIVYDKNQQQLTSNEDDRQIPFVLISHGLTGGDFMENGQRRSLSTSCEIKKQNIKDDLAFIDAPRSATNDDQLFYVGKSVLLSAYGFKSSS